MPTNPLHPIFAPTALPKFRLDTLSVASPQTLPAPPPPPQPKPYVPKWDPTVERSPEIWDRVQQLAPSINKAAKQTGWPKEYMNAQAIVESGAKNLPKQPVSTAKGVFQFRDYPNVEKQFANDNMNPDSSALHNAKMMQWLVAKNGGDTTAAIAQYNKGPYSGVKKTPYSDEVTDLVKQQRAAQAIQDWNSKYAKSITKISPKPTR